MDKNYYREYFELERYHWWFQVRSKILESTLDKFAKKGENKIINIGVATGATSEMLGSYGKVESLEYDKSCIEFVNQRTNLNIKHGSILELAYHDNLFDIVCAFDVIEHVNDDRKAVSEMIRVCKPGGIVCITVPAFMSLWSHHDVINHHFKRYRISEVVRLFDDKSNIVFKSYFNTILFPPILLMRVFTRIFPNIITRSGSGSDFTLIKYNFINKIFYSLFLAEKYLLKVFQRLPFGVSLFIIYRKPL
jgi:SAM-dependent methyltransferase